MAWVEPEFTPEQVNSAGRQLAQIEFPVDSYQGLEILEVLNNWRASHAYPLNAFQITLRRRSKKIEPNVIIAQRAKRLDSVHKKLSAKSTMRMTQMQDIAGCRAVFLRLVDVYKLVTSYKSDEVRHKFRNEKDYIKNGAYILN